MTKLIDFKKSNDKVIYNSGTLVAEYIVSSPISSITIDNLDIKRDGGVYDIVIMEFTPTTSSGGHLIRINGIIDGYWGRHFYYWNNITTPTVTTHSGCLGFCNGWNQGSSLFFTTATLMYFNKDWIGFQAITNSNGTSSLDKYVTVWQNCQLLFKEVPNITSLQINANDGLIGAGSIIKIYKRLGGGGIRNLFKKLYFLGRGGVRVN